jgi:N-acetylglucosamine-6-phosphate deacetylase
MGLSAGMIHRVGDIDIHVKEDKRAVVANTDTLCGSVSTFNECIQIFQKSVGCSLAEALKCGSENPARLLKTFPKKGSLNYGADADFAIIDDNINVKSTFIEGDLVWSDDKWQPKLKIKNWQN